MRSALSRRIRREFTRRRTRSLLTIATLAAAIAGVWMFALPNQLEAVMSDRIADDRIHDVIIRPNGVELDEQALEDLRAVPNVEALDVRAFWYGQLRHGDRVQDALVVGVADFSDQRVNVVRIDSGHGPGSAGEHEALSDPQNGRIGRFTGTEGDTVTITDFAGRARPLEIVGQGSTAYYSNSVVDADPVLYVPMDVVWQLADHRVYTQIEFIVSDRSDEATLEAVDAIRTVLSELHPDVSFRALAEIRPDGEWPGEDDFDNFVVLFWVIGTISFLSAALLIATTMNTLVREQTREIGIMKAVGGSRRQVALHFASNALVLGAAGTVVGIAAGAALSYFLVEVSTTELIGVATGWRFSWLALVLSVVVGLGVTVLASMPAVLRGVRIPVHDAIGSQGLAAGFGEGRLDRSVARMRFLPRFVQLGARSAVRQKGRSLVTILQVSLAVGTMLGFAATLITMVEVSEQSRTSEGGDIRIWSSGPGAALDDSAAETISAIDGVARVQPLAAADLVAGSTDTFTWGFPADPVYPYELSDGRWFTEAENEAAASVAVVGPAIARLEDLEVGDTLRIEAIGGASTVEVIGIDGTMVGDGQVVFLPIDTVMEMKGQTHPSQFWVETESSDHDRIDSVALAVRTELARERYGFDYELRYIDIEAERASDRTVIALIMFLGVPVVAIGMIGLVNTVSTNIVERQREIGVLRSLGARARDIRRFFRVEAIVLVVAGWIAGIAVGYLVGRIVLRFVNDAFHVDFALRYPPWPPGVALVVVLAVAGLALSRPLARASRLSPSEVLRYE